MVQFSILFVKKAIINMLMYFPCVYIFLYQKDSEACRLCPNIASQLFCWY